MSCAPGQEAGVLGTKLVREGVNVKSFDSEEVLTIPILGRLAACYARPLLVSTTENNQLLECWDAATWEKRVPSGPAKQMFWSLAHAAFDTSSHAMEKQHAVSFTIHE